MGALAAGARIAATIAPTVEGMVVKSAPRAGAKVLGKAAPKVAGRTEPPPLPGGRTGETARAERPGAGGGGNKGGGGGNDRAGAGGAPQPDQPANEPSTTPAKATSDIGKMVESISDIANQSKAIVKDVVGKPFDELAGHARKGQAAVNNDMAGLIEQFDGLPDGVKKFTRALSDLVGAIDSNAKRLAPYSGKLSLAGAQADVRKMHSDINEAKYVEDSYGRVEDEKSKLDAQIVEVMNPIKDSIANLVADVLPILRDMLSFYQTFLQPAVIAGLEIGRAGVQAMTLQFGKAIETLNGIPEAIAKANRKVDYGGAFLKDIFTNSVAEARKLRPRPGPQFAAANGFVGLAGL